MVLEEGLEQGRKITSGTCEARRGKEKEEEDKNGMNTHSLKALLNTIMGK